MHHKPDGDMHAVATVKRQDRGQFTIPAKVRQAAGLQSGTRYSSGRSARAGWR